IPCHGAHPYAGSMRLRLSCALAVVVLLGACSSGDTDESTPDAQASQADAPTDGAAVEDQAGGTEVGRQGTWDDPLAAGTPVTLTGWGVTIGPGEVVTEALDPALSPPGEGEVYVLAEVSATRTGSEPGSL